MKKQQLLLGSLILLAISANAQTWSGTNPMYTTNQVRIGGGSTAINKTLHIGDGASNLHFGTNGVLIKFAGGTSDRALLELHSPDGANRLVFQSLSNASYLGSLEAKPLILQSQGGNVGIGTTAPNAAIEILQSTGQTNGIKYTSLTLGNPAFEIVTSGYPGNSRFKTFGDGKTYIGNFTSPTYNANASILTLGQPTATDKAISVINSTNPTAADVFAVYGDGKTIISGPALTELRVTTPTTNASKVWVCNSLSSYNFGIDNAAVGHIGCNINSPTPVNIMNFGLQGSAQPQVWIGNTKPQSPHTDFSFAVAGKMVAQSLFITAAGAPNWADYVFADDYKLQSLSEIESYYKANKHLPEIPTTKEVEEKGIDIGEMNVLLLKKIEELTIHMVQQNKQMLEQQKQIDALNAKIK